MKYHYIAVTVMQSQDKFTDQKTPETSPGYFSYVVKCAVSDNLVSVLAGIKGLQTANVFPAKKRADETVNIWNECHKANGQYLFDTERKEAAAV